MYLKAKLIEILKNQRANTAMAAMFAILFLDGLGISVILPLLPNLFINDSAGFISQSTDENTRHMLYSLCLMSYSFAMFLGAPILGQLSDRFGRKPILVVSLLGTAVGYLICSISIINHSVNLLILGRLLDGLTAGSIPIAQAAMMDISEHRNKMANIGLVLFFVTAGYMVGPIIPVFLSFLFGPVASIQLSFYVPCVLSVFGMLLLSAYKQSRQVVSVGHIEWIKAIKIFSELKQLKNLQKLLLAMFGLQVAWSSFFQYLPLYLTNEAESCSSAIALSFAGAGMVLSFCILTRVVGKRFEVLNTCYTNCIALSITMFLFYLFTPSHIAIYLISFCGASLYSLAYSSLLTYASNKVSKESQGLLMGSVASICALSAIISLIVGSSIIRVNVVWLPVFCSLLFLMTFSLLIYPDKNYEYTRTTG